MLQTTTLKFLSSLEKNNNKPWFDSHRKAYDAAKEDFLSLVAQLLPEMSAFDPSLSALEAKNCTFRINRDVRFSPDKRPYKNNMAAYFNKEGKKGEGAGYYFHLQPGKSFAAAGIWMPEPANLAKIRQEIDYNLEVWTKLMDQRSFKKYFPGGLEQSNLLSRPPKGYTDDNPAIPFLKLKSLVLKSPLADSTITGKTLVKELSKIFNAAKPMIDFLNVAIE